jgi:hypothetical protein
MGSTASSLDLLGTVGITALTIDDINYRNSTAAAKKDGGTVESETSTPNMSTASNTINVTWIYAIIVILIIIVTYYLVSGVSYHSNHITKFCDDI